MQTILNDNDKQLQTFVTDNQHFLLSLTSQMEKVPPHLLGLCKMHIMDIVNHYKAGVVPTQVLPLQPPQPLWTEWKTARFFVKQGKCKLFVNISQVSLFWSSLSFLSRKHSAELLSSIDSLNVHWENQTTWVRKGYITHIHESDSCWTRSNQILTKICVSSELTCTIVVNTAFGWLNRHKEEVHTHNQASILTLV